MFHLKGRSVYIYYYFNVCYHVGSMLARESGLY